jgi:hypothetical protein
VKMNQDAKIVLSAEDAQLRSELLVSAWHKDNRLYLGGGGGLDWQARRALTEDIKALLLDVTATDNVPVACESQLRRRRNRGSDPEAP